MTPNAEFRGRESEALEVPAGMNCYANGGISVVTRLWKGQKEAVTEPYFCGQVWNVERQLWDTVTKEYASEKDADIALNEYLEVHNAGVTSATHNEPNEG